MTISKEYEHLSNSETAELLASHRLVPTGQRQKRFENRAIPFGEKLIALVRERLMDLETTITEDRPAPDRMTPEAALNAITAITTLDDLVKAFTNFIEEAAPLAVANNDLTTPINEMKSRVESDITSKAEPAVPAAPTDEELITSYNNVNSPEDLEAELTATKSDDVKSAVTTMVDRVKDAIVKGIPQPTPAPAPEQDQPEPDLATKQELEKNSIEKEGGDQAEK